MKEGDRVLIRWIGKYKGVKNPANIPEGEKLENTYGTIDFCLTSASITVCVFTDIVLGSQPFWYIPVECVSPVKEEISFSIELGFSKQELKKKNENSQVCTLCGGPNNLIHLFTGISYYCPSCE